jgi:hypothetical protein
MIIQGDKEFIPGAFDSEEELERVVVANADRIFGPDSLFLSKALIHSADGAGTIPDGFAVDLAQKRWYVVEAELAVHSVWSHIAPQVAKQIIAASQPASRELLVDKVVLRVKEEPAFAEKFAEQDVAAIDIRHFLTEILSQEPIIGLPIDRVSQDLREWAQTLKTEVRLWTIRKLVEFGNPANVMYEIPDDFQPDLDTAPGTSTPYFSGVTLLDLMDAGFLEAGQTLRMTYKPLNGAQTEYAGIVGDDGSLEVDGERFSSVSYAALYGIQDAGSDRTSVNGWTSWKTEGGERLADVRARYLEQQNG